MSVTVDAPASTKKRWTLTESAFNKLLDGLDPDRQRAGEKFGQLHGKLEKFFEAHRSAFAEELADETINRVTRKLEEGLEIQSLTSYCIGVARMLLKETLKEQMKRQELHDLPSTVPPDLEDSSEAETQLGCLDGCLEKLPAEIRSLILEYYQFRRQAKIDHRRALAEGFGIPVNALRIRVHRVRAQLEECVTDCITAERRDMN